MNYKITKAILVVGNTFGLLISAFSVFIVGGNFLFSGLSDASVSNSNFFQSALPFVCSILYEFLIYKFLTSKLENVIKNKMYESTKASLYDICALGIFLLALIPLGVAFNYGLIG